jgi:manganese-dependent inorganic pyrophosphatase
MAEYLSNITDLDIQKLGRDIMDSASVISSKGPAEIVRLDMKEYSSVGKRFSVSQVEVTSPGEIMEKREAIQAALRDIRRQSDYFFSALMVTDITELSSLLFIEADPDFIGLLKYPKHDKNVYELKEILSRKKQLMPVLTDLVEKYAGA